jgi:hypothetical protein
MANVVIESQGQDFILTPTTKIHSHSRQVFKIETNADCEEYDDGAVCIYSDLNNDIANSIVNNLKTIIKLQSEKREEITIQNLQEAGQIDEVFLNLRKNLEKEKVLSILKN